MIVDLEVDGLVFDPKDSEEASWFANNVLAGFLVLHSNEIGDEVGLVRVLKVLSPDDVVIKDAELARLRAVLGFYANEKNYNDDCAPYVERPVAHGPDEVMEEDLGGMARAALDPVAGCDHFWRPAPEVGEGWAICWRCDAVAPTDSVLKRKKG
jgi:hypothetical protein